MNNTIRVVGLGAASALVGGVLVAAAPTASADNVNIPPLRRVTGGLNNPIGVAHDAAGRTYVASGSSSTVLVYRKNANGPTVPTRTLDTGVVNPYGVDVDNNGFVYVANGNGQISIYSPNADSGDPPVRSFGTGPGEARGVDVGPNSRIYVRKPTGINVYEPNAAGSPAPTFRAITGVPNAYGIDVESNGLIWTPGSSAVLAYGPAANGAATPLRTITRPGLGAVLVGVDRDAGGRIYLASNTNDSVYVFPSNADGPTAPIKVLGGVATRLVGPGGIDIAAGTTTVTNNGDNSYVEFRTLFVKAPSKPRALRVAGKRGAKKRKVSWKAPADNGGAPITGYRLVVKKGGTTLLTKNFGPGKRSFKLKRSSLRNGKNTVLVKAKNSKGFGKNAKKSFRVRK